MTKIKKTSKKIIFIRNTNYICVSFREFCQVFPARCMTNSSNRFGNNPKRFFLCQKLKKRTVQNALKNLAKFRPVFCETYTLTHTVPHKDLQET